MESNAQEITIITPKDTTILANAAITWKESGLPRSDTYDDIYFSAANPIEESRHVFINGNDLETRMPHVGHTPLVIGECGFGFGINFLVTCERFCELSPRGSKMHFLSCEAHPVLKKDLERFYKTLPSTLQPYAENLLDHYPEQGKGLHRIVLQHQQHLFILDLIYDDAPAAFQKLSTHAPVIDAWYLDGYSPSKNEAMWDTDLINIIAKLSKSGTTLATYSVAGMVRENLKHAGFAVSKRKGFGKKRQMLSGVMPALTKITHHWEKSWSNPWPEKDAKVSKVGIIGAGLAGSATAHALALRGYSVTVLEKNASIASGASGNPRGLVHFNPGRQLTPANLFRLSAFSYAVRHYRNLAKHHNFAWQSCGLVQLARDKTELEEYRNLLEQKLYDSGFMTAINAEQATNISGLALSDSGLFFPQAGSLDPVALCQTWTSQNTIKLFTNRDVSAINFHEELWQVDMNGPNGPEKQKFDALVICDNGASPGLAQENKYPLRFNFGQTDSFNLDGLIPASSFLKCPVRKKGYLIPWGDEDPSRITIGGSFAAEDKHSNEHTTMQKHNFQMLKDITPVLHESPASDLYTDIDKISSRRGMRCSTPDYLPLAGPVEEKHLTSNIFSGYQRNARKEIMSNPHYYPGLYINIAHGSSGLVTTPLLGEYIASLISRESLPINHDEIAAVLPMRYLIRDLKRQKA